MIALPVLAGAPSTEEVTSGVIVVLGQLLAALLLGAVLVYLVRRWVRSPDAPAQGFSLDDLRELRQSGEISDEEFRAARNALISQVRRHAAPKEGGGSLGDRGPER